MNQHFFLCRQQGSFPSTSAKTPPKQPSPPPEPTQQETTPTEDFPRVEGPLIRKWDLDAGGSRHSRGRSWASMYVTLQEGKLTFYRDQRTRREHPDDTFRGEATIELGGARAAPALDYTKRPFVFRLRVFAGAEYLFQAVSEEVLLRWVAAINDSANKLAPRGPVRLPQRAFSLPTTSRHSRASSATSSQPTGMQRRYSSLRRVLKRH